jgi:hypothetical protein
MGSPTIQGTFRHGLPRTAQRSREPRTANGGAIPLADELSRFPSHGGSVLAPQVRARMEDFFRTSFADVRVHVGRDAPAIGALAFTIGSHIHFAPGLYDPSSRGGQQLLAHELTHVVQQRTGRVHNPFGNSVAVVHDRVLEAEADRMAQRAVQMAPAAPVGAGRALQPKSSQVVQMKKPCEVCGHRHGSTRCTTQVDDGNGGTRACGCTSHSGSWDSHGKFNPGSGRHARMLERLGTHQ